MSNVGIIGGGVSGVISAIYASKNGNKVTILEKNNDILKTTLSMKGIKIMNSQHQQLLGNLAQDYYLSKMAISDISKKYNIPYR